MLNSKQEKLLALLRNNCRMTFTDIERVSAIPASTAYDNVKILSQCVTKFTSLVDFECLGYPIRKRFLIASKSREELSNVVKRFLGLNNLQVTNGWQVYCECYFRNLREVQTFVASLRMVKPKIVEIDILEELKHEEFVPRLH